MSDNTIDDVKHFDSVTHDPDTAAVSDADADPTYDVFEEGTDTPILAAQTMTKRTSKTGNYRGSFTLSTANGFEAGKWYSVVVTATVGGITAKDVALNFRVGPAESVAGVPKVDVSHFDGTAGTFSGGRPSVNVNSLANNSITTASINDGAITAAKFASGALDAVWSTSVRTLSSLTALAADIRAALGMSSNNLDTQLAAIAGYIDTEIASLVSGLSTANSNITTILARIIALAVATGTVQSDGGNSTTQFKTNLTETSNDHWKESFVLLTSGTLTGAIRKIDGYNGTTKIITVTPAFPSTPANSVTFSIINR